jgi:hypothetical protein
VRLTRLAALAVTAAVLATGMASAPAQASPNPTTKVSPGIEALMDKSAREAALAEALRDKAAPFVVVSGNQATILPTAATHLTTAELTTVRSEVAQFNVASGSSTGDSGVTSSVGNRPGCYWSWHANWNWWGWTISMNDCAATFIATLIAAGAGAAGLAFYLGLPAFIAAVLAAVAGILFAWVAICQQFGSGNVSWHDNWLFGWPGC